MNVLLFLAWLFWCIGLVSAVSALLFPSVAKATMYGKLNTWSHYPLRSGYVFTSYYVIASLWNAVMINWVLRYLRGGVMPPLSSFFRYSDPHTGPFGLTEPLFTGDINVTNVLMPLGLLQLHSFKRLYECLRIHKFSPESRTTLVVHVAGIAFYMGLVCSIAGDSGLFAAPVANLKMAMQAHHLVGFGIFLWGSNEQLNCHIILADLRKSSNGNVNMLSARGVPMGGPFAKRTCPHYFAEVVIYFGLALTTGGCNMCMWLALCWCALNLTVTANQTHAWYLRTFDAYKNLRRRPMW